MSADDTFEIAPVFPVSNIADATRHYGTLGFEVETYDGAPYAFARRGQVQLHLAEVPKIRPKKNLSAAYLWVADANAMHQEWSTAGHGGTDIAPTATDYGLLEGAHLDPDANLLRYGSAI